MRACGRTPEQIRPVTITRRYTCHAEGSVLIQMGNTHVLCTASVEEGVPRFLRGKNQGWVTAEYSMLPRATHTRVPREAAKGKQGGRTLEIQRLIARSLRAAVDLEALGERTIIVDCDVIQADGGTRTAAITGGCVALHDALQHLVEQGELSQLPLKTWIAAVSVGLVDGIPVCDLNYAEDSNAQTDMNIIMNGKQRFIEIQGTAEQGDFSLEENQCLLTLGQQGIAQLLAAQQESIAQTKTL